MGNKYVWLKHRRKEGHAYAWNWMVNNQRTFMENDEEKCSNESLQLIVHFWDVLSKRATKCYFGVPKRS